MQYKTLKKNLIKKKAKMISVILVYLCASKKYHEKKTLLLLLATGSIILSKAQSIAGNWEGTLNVQGTEIPIVFHIKDSAGKLSATFDSPKQMAYNLACSGVLLHGDSMILQMKMMGGKYESLLSADKKTTRGTWFQGGGSLPLDLKKTSDVATKQELKRPQTPRPPFPYNAEEIIFAFFLIRFFFRVLYCI